MLIKKTSTLHYLGLGLLFAICMVSSGRADQPSFTTIDVPGAFVTAPFGINPQGDIVGYYYLGATGFHGFLLSKGAFTTIDGPSASITQVFGINPSGDIVGFYGNATGRHGFLLSKGAFTTIAR